MRQRVLFLGAVVAFIAGTTAACVEPPPSEDFPVGCYDYQSGTQVDLDYLGPIDTANNARFTFSSNGTCSGGTDPSFVRTVVRAADKAAADTACQELTGSIAIYQLDQPELADYDAAPSDVWFCPAAAIPT